MSVSNPILIKTYIAAAAIVAHRLVTWGAADGEVRQSVAGDAHIGVALDDAAAGERVDVVRAGIAEVEYGGVVARGDRLDATSIGRAVAAAGTVQHQALITGGAAGAHAVTGLLAGDTLISVLQFDVAADTGTSATGNKVQALADLTAEFDISADAEIDNTGGTATTGDQLLVIWERRAGMAGFAEVSGVTGDICPMLVQMG